MTEKRDRARERSERIGVYPGSFDPLTVAHLAIADAARREAALDRVDLALSEIALGKARADQRSVEARAAAIERAARSRPWLGVTITDAQLVADIATGYDAVVMGADKWAQVCDPSWYGNDERARDAALAALPPAFVAPRPGFDVVGAHVLDIDPEHADVSSTRARAGEHHLVVPESRRRVIVDGNNVVGSRPDGWWRDRAGASRKLVSQLGRLATRTGDDICVVFDGRPPAGFEEGVRDGVRVAYANRSGRNAADDRIVELVAGDADAGSLVVVTSDRELARRVGELGAQVQGAGRFGAELEGP